MGCGNPVEIGQPVRQNVYRMFERKGGDLGIEGGDFNGNILHCRVFQVPDIGFQAPAGLLFTQQCFPEEVEVDPNPLLFSF